ncbi:DUF6624 domain-containing protein [Plantactinospora sp. BB1]|uniref:DUF6624 domain-containing protein n=1 Tax=Plantactinospora sp. BB1 TaxID=2071627 RepID=UPI001F231001|nr:DUF6624 domain-containing protein [Plantactinospora sp. BB1]
MGEYQQIAAELLAMADTVQQMRTRALADMDAWDIQIDRANTARLNQIVDQIGWPTVSKVGREASSSAWLLVQHVPDSLDFMRHCLELMKQAEPGEVKLSNIALLEDPAGGAARAAVRWPGNQHRVGGRRVAARSRSGTGAVSPQPSAWVRWPVPHGRPRWSGCLSCR